MDMGSIGFKSNNRDRKRVRFMVLKEENSAWFHNNIMKPPACGCLLLRLVGLVVECLSVEC